MSPRRHRIRRMSATPTSLLHRVAGYFSPGRFGRHLGLQFWQILLETGFRMVATFAAAILLGPEIFGLLGVVMTGVFFFQTTLEGGLSSLMRSISREKQTGEATGPQVAFWGIILFLGVVLLLGLIVYLVMASIGVTPGGEGAGLLLLGALLAIGTVGKLVVEVGLKGLRDYTKAAILGTIIAPIQATACVVALLMGYGLHVYLALLAMFLGGNMLVLLLWFIVRHGESCLSRPPAALGRQLGEMGKYALPLLFRGFVVFFFLRVNLLVIETFSPGETGFYAFAEKFMLIPLLLVGAIMGALCPRITQLHSSGRIGELSDLLARTYTTLLLLLLPFLLFFLLSPWILTPFFPAYAPAMPLIQLFAPLVLVDALGFLAVGGLMIFTGHARKAILFDLAGAIANTLVVLWLVRSHGAAGVIAGSLVVHAVYTLVVIPVAFRLAGARFRLAGIGMLTGTRG